MILPFLLVVVGFDILIGVASLNMFGFDGLGDFGFGGLS